MFKAQPTGMRAFVIIWGGQLVSTVGTAMSRFALLIWLWERTHQATAMTLVGISMAVPSLLITPFAGALVDRWNRKRVMMISDLIAGLGSVAILLLYTAGNLQIADLYVVAGAAAVAGQFQSLAYTAATTTLIPKDQYARASGMISLSQYASQIGAPILAGILVTVIGIQGVLLIDIITFVFAVSVLLVIPVPQPEATAPEERKSLLHESLFGFRYIFQRPSFVGLLAVYFAFNAAESLGYPLIAPMILARTGSNEVILGTVQSVMGIGGVIGGILLTVWGGPKRRIHGIWLSLMLTGLLGDALMGTGQMLPVWLVAGFFLEVFIPTMLGSNSSIWQSKVPPEVQGRVFAARGLVTSIADPLSLALGGILADRLFEPAMMPDGNLTPILGGLVGTGPGAGMGVMLVICGLLSAFSGLAGYAIPAVRHVEDILPDYVPVLATHD